MADDSVALSPLTDIPRHVAARALLRSGRCRVLADDASAESFIVVGLDAPLVCVIGRPRAELVHEAAACAAKLTETVAIRALPEDAGHLAIILPEWEAHTAILHSLSPDGSMESSALPAPGADHALSVRMMGAVVRGSFDHFPAALRAEVDRVLEEAPVAVALAHDTPVAVCYPAWQTESLWDLAVATLPDWRGRGLARRCAATMVIQMQAQGLSPVWGALEEDQPSLRLARRLGFAPVDRMVVFSSNIGVGA